MERHRNYDVKRGFARQRLVQKPSKRPSKGSHAAVLEQVDQLPQRAFVGSIRIDRVEAPQSQTAQSAAAGFVQGEAIDERHPAGRTEIFRDQWLGLGKALAANRNSGKLLEGFAANAAIIWKD
jgi:hypothetical protein